VRAAYRQVSDGVARRLRPDGAMPTSVRVQLGKWGEDCACRELRRRGYEILERRYRTRVGEIDIVASDRGVLVFVEVKARRSTAFGRPVEAVTGQKQRKLLQLAACYIATNRLHERPCRFDVVSVSLPPGATEPRIEILQGAFDASCW
jgi:putative endonuclease